MFGIDETGIAGATGIVVAEALLLGDPGAALLGVDGAVIDVVIALGIAQAGFATGAVDAHLGNEALPETRGVDDVMGKDRPVERTGLQLEHTPGNLVHDGQRQDIVGHSVDALEGYAGAHAALPEDQVAVNEGVMLVVVATDALSHGR